jgi:hypothetical protein
MSEPSLKTALNNAVKTALAEAWPDVISEALNDAEVCTVIDEFMTSCLADARCWISFEKTGLDILIGVGPGDCAVGDVSAEISVTDYTEVAQPYPAQMEHISEQIAGIDNFIAKLINAKRQLEEALAKKQEQLGSLE